ncbi:ATP-binding protein [Streptomyces sp. NPDC042638]|uniref:ATP-binding protein n=1 Tax=Streptomyces sp. NPDC042638 TaxID=3154333 RepID=UPI0033D8F55D
MATAADRAGPTDLAVLVGLQASGKSTFCARCLSDRYELVSKDRFPRGARNKQDRQMRLVEGCLAAGRPVAVDNTNPSPEEWRPLVAAAKAHGATVTAYWFPPDVAGSLRRNARREGRDRVPDAGVLATLKRLRRPSVADGFDAVHEVRFDGMGGFEVRT